MLDMIHPMGSAQEKIGLRIAESINDLYKTPIFKEEADKKIH